MLKRFSLRRKSTSWQFSGEAEHDFPVQVYIEGKVESPPRAIHKCQNSATIKEEQAAAAESLRRRFEAELRPALLNDSLHKVLVTQSNFEGSLGRHARDPDKKQADQRVSSPAIRQVSNQRTQTNAFGSLGSSAVKLDEELKANSQRLPRADQGARTEQENSEQNAPPGFTSVDLASVQDIYKNWRTGMTTGTRAPWQHVDSLAYPDQKSAQTLRSSMSAPVNVARTSSRAFDRLRSLNRSSGHSSGSSSESFNSPVVVARAVCELEHPRPSRWSETRLLQGRVQNNEHSPAESAGGKSQGSQDSETSFHTARQASSGS